MGSPSPLPTRFTPSRRSSRPLTSTTLHTPPTPPRRSSPPSTPQSTLSLTRPSVSRGLLSMLDMLLLDPLLPPPMSLLPLLSPLLVPSVMPLPPLLLLLDTPPPLLLPTLDSPLPPS